MTVIYRDTIGLVRVEADTQYAISFLNGEAFFVGLDGKDYRINVNAIANICGDAE